MSSGSLCHPNRLHGDELANFTDRGLASESGVFDVAQRQLGYSKDMSMYALEDYTQVKHVMARIAQTVGASFLPA